MSEVLSQSWHLNAGLTFFFALPIFFFENVFRIVNISPQNWQSSSVYFFNVLLRTLTDFFSVSLKFYAFFISYLWFDDGIRKGGGEKYRYALIWRWSFKYAFNHLVDIIQVREKRNDCCYTQKSISFFSLTHYESMVLTWFVTASNTWLADRPTIFSRVRILFPYLLKNSTHVYHVHFKLGTIQTLQNSRALI